MLVYLLPLTSDYISVALQYSTSEAMHLTHLFLYYNLRNGGEKILGVLVENNSQFGSKVKMGDMLG